MRVISSLLVCLALSACATDYVSQLYQPNYGVRGVHYTETTIDPALLMNGSYASKQTNGFYGSSAFCLTDYRCSPLAQQRSLQARQFSEPRITPRLLPKFAGGSPRRP